MTYAPIQGKCPACHQDSANTSFQAGAASRDAEVAEHIEEIAALKEVIKHGDIQRERDMELAGEERDQLRAELAAEQANNARLRDFIASAQVSSGVCCCGEAMDGHSSPMSCGHSPVDMWDHAVENLLDAPSDTSTPEQSLAEYRNNVIEECASVCDKRSMRKNDGNWTDFEWDSICGTNELAADEIRAMKEQP